jgi:hypothetical protein
MGRPVVDLSGEHFGKLEVIRFAYTRNGHAYWHCHCACGEDAVVRADALRAQDTCGVARKHISDRSERFWSHVNKKGPDECWEWTATRHRQGYGLFYDVTPEGDRAGQRYAHIVAYELGVGPVPDGKEIRHSCDNPPCCNPNHLELGTHQENMEDRSKRNRTNITKITFEQVGEIRRLAQEGIPQTEIARQFEISASNVSCIVSRKTRRVG